MKKSIRIIFGLIILTLFSLFPPVLIPVNITSGNEMNSSDSVELKTSSVFKLNSDEEAWVDSVLDKMTIRERIAQMIMPWAGGNYTSESSSEFQRVKYLVEDLRVGGLIFFKGDILNEALLINRFQTFSDVPLLISSDFERGLAMRLTDATEFPYNMALAASGNLRLAKEMGRIISVESRAIGVHQNYAPVADINTNADNPIINVRAYSEDKNIVSDFAQAFIDGTVNGRVIATIKHFPGHGSTLADSHQELPVISSTREELFNNELVPFIRAINSGVHSVMIGHLSIPSIEPEKLPATLSAKIITDLLKNELGFRGLIVTDAMNMNAVTRNFSSADAAVRAVKAGNDIILMPPDELIAINAISDAVHKGEISMERINESVRKILSAKKWIGLDKEKTSDISQLPSVVGTRKNVFLAREIAEKSITLVRNSENLIPLNPQKYYSVAVISVSDGYNSGSVFNELADQEFGYIRTASLNRNSPEKDFKKALEIAGSSDLILIPSYIKVRAYQGTVKMSEKQSRFVSSLLNVNKPAVLISLGNPYLLSLFPETKTYITSYGDAYLSMHAMIRAITGKTDITGKLPISIAGTNHKTGDGIELRYNRLISDAEGYDFEKTASVIKNALDQKLFSGSSIAVSSSGKILYRDSFGKTDFYENSTPINNDFIYDIDEVTSLVTTAGALILASEGLIDPERNVSYYLPEYKNFIRTSELFYQINDEQKIFANDIAAVRNGENKSVLLQKIMEKVTGASLDKILYSRIFHPLNMKNTMFNLRKEFWFYALPTSDEVNLKKRNKGVVYDEESFNMNGVAGHAGLFTTTGDMAVFLQMILQKGKYGNKQIINENIFDGWYNNPSSDLVISGKTGSAIWVSPSRNMTLVFFSNSSFTGRTSEMPKIYSEVFNSIKNNLVY